eukprot:5038569-Heterocapsa_arctica.AAC.1
MTATGFMSSPSSRRIATSISIANATHTPLSPSWLLGRCLVRHRANDSSKQSLCSTEGRMNTTCPATCP